MSSWRALRHDARVGGEDAVDVGVDLADVGVERRGQRDRGGVRAAAAERGDVLGVLADALEAGDDRDRRRRRALRGSGPGVTSMIRALPCAESVMHAGLRAGERLRASEPRLSIAIASSAIEIRSPAVSSMSSSRAGGSGDDLLGEVEQLVGGVAHRGDDDDDVVARRGGWRRCARRPA